jgi:hypothetical protein
MAKHYIKEMEKTTTLVTAQTIRGVLMQHYTIMSCEIPLNYPKFYPHLQNN